MELPIYLVGQQFNLKSKTWYLIDALEKNRAGEGARSIILNGVVGGDSVRR